MNGLRLKVRHWVGGELGWSCLGVGMGELLGGGDRLERGGGGTGQENLKSCSQTEYNPLGHCRDRRLCSRIWYRVEKWIQRHTARGALTHPHLQIHLVTTCDIITTAGKSMADPEGSCKRTIVYYRARQGNYMHKRKPKK